MKNPHPKLIRALKSSPTIVILLAIFALRALLFASENSNLRWYSFNDGIAEAKKSNRKILVDVYTDWCGWCKKMDASTYGNAEVATYLNQRYVVIKLNAESNKKLIYNDKEYTEREFAAAFGITGYPSTLFLKSDGEPITIYPGFADAQKFKTVLSYIAEDHYLTKTFEKFVGSSN